MSKLNVVEWPAAVLETKSQLVTTFDDALLDFVASMHETMDDANGIGLAANQVGVAKQIITIHIPFEDNKYEDQESENCEVRQPWHDTRFTLINPKIIKSTGKIRWQEGCLSFPEIYEFVDRASEVWVKAHDAEGNEFEVHGTGLFAVCLQHEIDHINGIVFVNRMSRLKAGLVKRKMARRGKLEVGDVAR